jgi:hypothetical protein
LPPARDALPAPAVPAPDVVIGRTGEAGPGHPSRGADIPAYEEDATSVLRRPGLAPPAGAAYDGDATMFLPRPRRSAEDGERWAAYRPENPEGQR